MIFVHYQKIGTLPKIHTLPKYLYLTENFEHLMSRSLHLFIWCMNFLVKYIFSVKYEYFGKVLIFQ